MPRGETAEMTDKLALIFPGQGSQYVGMGLDLYGEYREARSVFDEVDRALGFKLSKLCFEGPQEELDDTVNTQVAVLTMSLATLKAMGDVQSVGEVSSVAGHSLGEYSALVAAGKIPLVDAVRLVRERGRLMKEAGERHPGGMAAVLGLAAEPVGEACAQAQVETRTTIQVANHNSPEQIVISGERAGLERAIELVKEKGARRVVTLAVSIASHSSLMESVSRGLREALLSINFSETDIPLVGNVTAKPLLRAEEIRDELIRQVVSPVQWVASVHSMVDQGVRTFVEIGPKDTLSKLMKRIVGDVQSISVGDVSAVEAWRKGTLPGRQPEGE
jgi:[acyl-carrier-protein] S-malonyltransferase